MNGRGSSSGDPAVALVASAQSLARLGNEGTSGNVSARCHEGFLITPSGTPYEQLSADMIVTIENGGRVLGDGRPSSEWRFHHDIYAAQPDVMAVVHTHPTYATALACLGEGLPAFHYEVAFAGGNSVRCADYATFGTQRLSDNVLSALEGRSACLMANHGMLCTGPDLPSALGLTAKLEQLCQVYLQCLAVRPPLILSDEEMDVVLAKFKDYGPRTD